MSTPLTTEPSGWCAAASPLSHRGAVESPRSLSSLHVAPQSYEDFLTYFEGVSVCRLCGPGGDPWHEVRKKLVMKRAVDAGVCVAALRCADVSRSVPVFRVPSCDALSLVQRVR